MGRSMSRSMGRSMREGEVQRPARRLLMALLLGAFSCTTEGDVITPQGVPGEPDQDGTRLRVAYQRFKAEDGARVTMPTNRFFDTKLGVECSFMPAEDGSLRCLPMPVFPLPGFPPAGVQLNGGYYLDSGCKQQVHRVRKCDPAPSYVFTPISSSSCGYKERPLMYKLGPAVVPNSLWGAGPDPCKPVSPDAVIEANRSLTLYPVTAMGPEEFVKGEQVSAVAP